MMEKEILTLPHRGKGSVQLKIESYLPIEGKVKRREFREEARKRKRRPNTIYKTVLNVYDESLGQLVRGTQRARALSPTAKRRFQPQLANMCEEKSFKFSLSSSPTSKNSISCQSLILEKGKLHRTSKPPSRPRKEDFVNPMGHIGIKGKRKLHTLSSKSTKESKVIHKANAIAQSITTHTPNAKSVSPFGPKSPLVPAKVDSKKIYVKTKKNAKHSTMGNSKAMILAAADADKNLKDYNGLPGLRKSAKKTLQGLSRKRDKRLLSNYSQVLETTKISPNKQQQKINGFQQVESKSVYNSKSKVVDRKSSTPHVEFNRSDATASALKIADDTVNFVRTKLKAVEDSKLNDHIRMNSLIQPSNCDEMIQSEAGPHPVTISRPSTKLGKSHSRKVEQGVLPTFNLECFGTGTPSNAISAEQLIKELAELHQSTKKVAKELHRKSVSKTHVLSRKIGKTNKRHYSPSAKKKAKPNIAKNDHGQTDKALSSAQPLAITRTVNMEKVVAGHTSKTSFLRGASKSSSKRNCYPKKLDRVPSGFGRLISGASGDKEFESALTMVVSTQEDEPIQWTKLCNKAVGKAHCPTITLNLVEDEHALGPNIFKKGIQKCPDRYFDRAYSKNPVSVVNTNRTSMKALSRGNNHGCTHAPSTRSKHRQPSTPSVLPDTKSSSVPKVAPDEFSNDHKHLDKHRKLSYDISNHEKMAIHKNDEDVESVLNREENEKAVLLDWRTQEDDSEVTTSSHHEAHDGESPGTIYEQSNTSDHEKTISLFGNLLIGGLNSPSDKENEQPTGNGRPEQLKDKNFGDLQKFLALKQINLNLDDPLISLNEPLHGIKKHRGKLSSSSISTKKKSSKPNSNIYLHSKDTLDFGEITLDAIQTAKRGLKNVFLEIGDLEESFTGTEDFETNNINGGEREEGGCEVLCVPV